VAGPSGEYSTCLTDEQRRDATQIRDFTTGVNPFDALEGQVNLVGIISPELVLHGHQASALWQMILNTKPD
jgi:hypothetical protein